MSAREPLWYKDAVIYELHVRAFFDSTARGFGEFRGLTQKLDYLQDLGVTAVWLLPFYPSPLRDDGYDIADYTRVHADYGALDSFQEFLDAAHDRGLRVITELVINHTSDQHPWFQRARRAARGTPERDFYVWSDSPEEYPDARVIFQDFETSNWSWDKTAQAYYWHRFYAHQPDLNFDNPAVWEAIFPVVDFWFERGVDGLRLDAVPYLYERPGTNCENLPETHAFLKALRRHVDDRFPDRMLLAEANQWPEDAVAYFGQGDECHMAFHFPLMPRLFMAIQMEDRLPLLDILEQTPAIPDNCQWALFLRNHDELTLEMVTDEERDYMYEAYATDPRARINLGIRHRLAPLLGNDRRRIELMNGLLFSLPGTPVLYYGDEIGMGDNIYLGDRNGVRTPMQWSGDRNAGFSRANPQRLYLPVIIDPQYHYETVNVETQQSNPHSLLWWTKRLIGLRRRHRAFGRGSLEFLRPANRRVLAFIRRDEDESILVLANLSRYTQHAELELADFAGDTPVELFGSTRFPPVGRAPYPVMLGPHSFHWFALAPPQSVVVNVAPAAQPSRPAADVEWPLVPGARAARRFEEALLQHLNRRTSPDLERISQVRVRDVFHLPDGDPPAHVLLLDVLNEASESASEWLPVQFVAGPPAAEPESAPRDAIAFCSRPRSGWICDATLRPEFNRRLIAFICSGQQVRSQADVVLEGVTRSAGCTAGEQPVHQLPVRLSPADQGRPRLVIGEQYVLSHRNRPAIVPRPDAELGRWLTERAAFPHAAPWIASLHCAAAGSAAWLLADLHGYVPNEGNAWQFTLEELSDYFERILASPLQGPADMTAASDEAAQEARFDPAAAVGGFVETARRMATRLADLHRALSSVDDDPDFVPERFSSAYQRSLYQSLRTLASQTCDDLRYSFAPLDDRSQHAAAVLEERRMDLHARLRALLDRRLSAWRIRIHGDFHLGQLLRTGSDFVLTGFDSGGREAAARRIKRSSLRDLAGLIHSLDFASRCALLGAGDREGRPVGVVRPEDVPRLRSGTEAWRKVVIPAVIAEYRRSVGDLPPLACPEHEFQSLFACFRLEQALLEIRRHQGKDPAAFAAGVEVLVDLTGDRPDDAGI